MSLEITGLRKRFGALVVTDGVELCVAVPGLHALIGPNGAGKTSLVNQVTGVLAPDAGSVRLGGVVLDGMAPHRRARAGLGRTFQVSQLVPGFTARENAALAAQAGRSLRPWGRADRDRGANAAAEAALASVGLDGRAAVLAEALSYGERRALELACTVAAGPRCVLLDEPLAGMGAEEAERMIELLARLKARFGLLMVEHDMDAVFRLADRVSVLVAGRIVASGTPEAVRADPAVRAAYLGDEA